jgi:signal transduction histidine kinase
MDFKQSLAQRIVIVFALMSTVVAGIFAIGIVAAVHVVERKLTDTSMAGNLNRLLKIDRAEDWVHRPEKDELFFADNGPADLALTDELRALPIGFQDALFNQQPYFAMVGEVGGRKYVLLRDRQSVEHREQLLIAVVVGGFALSVVLAMVLGRLLARRVMAPVILLARQIRQRDETLAHAPPLSTDYATDEVGELAVAFDQTLGKLRAALGREQQFTADVSHELRTPLQGLQQACSSLLDNPNIDPRAQRQVVRISRASAEMHQLIETFLLLARASDPAAGYGQQATLKQVADDLADIWGRQIAEKSLEFSYECDLDAPTLFNHTCLYSVMGNLLRNAWHYTDQGFVRLTLLPDGFMVEDSGIGIPEEKRNAMFQPFVRGDERRGEGLGLGLSLVQRICTSQGWTVVLTSREPHGCRFTVAWPVQSPPAMAEGRKSAET